MGSSSFVGCDFFSYPVSDIDIVQVKLFQGIQNNDQMFFFWQVFIQDNETLAIEFAVAALYSELLIIKISDFNFYG